MTVDLARDERDELSCILTDEHSASSYGIPVVLIAGEPYGPADTFRGIPAVDIVLGRSLEMIDADVYRFGADVRAFAQRFATSR